MTDPTVDATRELAAFLRRRRAELDPQDLGLPLRRRARRTPGLRREEVAELAGVSTDYVVRLEQARGLQPSADVVEALAHALRLTPGERDYLFGLARQRPRAVGKPAATAAPALARLVDDLSPRPVMLLNHRFDVLAWTAAMAALMVDFGALPPEQRNAVRLCLLHPGVRATHADRERVVRDGIAHLRAAWAAHPDDRRLGELIAECRAADPDVERWWSAQDVDLGGRGRKVLRHPELGEITTDFEVLRPLADTGQVLVVHRGADDASRAALDRLAA